MLISAGIDLDARVRDNPVLHLASMDGSRRLVAALLRGGARHFIYAPSVNGVADTPLGRAAAYAQPAVVHLLLQAGAHENMNDEHGRVPLQAVGRLAMTLPPTPQDVLLKRMKATTREILRGPAFRARSWAWPAGAGGEPPAAAGVDVARAGGGKRGKMMSPVEMVVRRRRGGGRLSAMWR